MPNRQNGEFQQNLQETHGSSYMVYPQTEQSISVNSQQLRAGSVAGSQYGSVWSMADSFPMYIVEFLGSFILTLTYSVIKMEESTLSCQRSKPNSTAPSMTPFGVGFVLVSLIYSFGHVSGGHFNPAVTLSVYIRRFITRTDAILFVISQVLGSVSGALISAFLTNKLPCLEPGHEVSMTRAFVGEAVYTFALCIVVINVATTASQRGNFFYGVAIGGMVSVGTTSLWNISGGIMNPALGTALSITNMFRNHGTIKYLWIYWAAPLLGGTFGGLSFYVINAKERTYEADIF